MGELHMTQFSFNQRESSPDIFDISTNEDRTLSPDVFELKSSNSEEKSIDLFQSEKNSTNKSSSDIFAEESGSITKKSSDIFSSMDVQYANNTQQSLSLFSDKEESESIDMFSSISSNSTKMEVENVRNSQLNLDENPKMFMMNLFFESHCDEAFNIQNSQDKRDDLETILGSPVDARKISDRSMELIHKIDVLLVKPVAAETQGKRLELIVQNRTDWSNVTFENETLTILPMEKAKKRHIRSKEVLTLVFFLLQEIRLLLSLEQICTIRELYYRDLKITKKQENVNEAVKVISCLLDASPWEFGVISTSKGLLAGNVKLKLHKNIEIDCSVHREGMLLPHLITEIMEISTTASFVLLVEKDTVFKKLALNDIVKRLNFECILITGKGYPDTNTRLILKKIYDCLNLPIYILTDADPYGIEIMLTYRHGSLSMSNQNDVLAVPSIRWLGVFPSDSKKYRIKSVDMTKDDNRKLENLINRPHLNNELFTELNILKEIKQKAEIEGVAESSCDYLIDVYLANKLRDKIFI